ncbi:Isochorismatase hydrolase [Lepidopterella palustris CBS 459.81]|uniref:nicotinamidase n=1 Tax=Lepidopterella palustris CBS 459.81 TaxID=1314670 RepID=A0A8E2EGI4_9PEZI|nr:Isochorismatase hydrolase [Lepidopterella palustris CBS 459.81]
MSFKPALVIVDLQEDFCPPNGSLAVPGGREIASKVNYLLSLPFALKIATKDFHPQDHISFASNHPPPNNKPFESFFTIKNPLNPEETDTTRLWPDHCVQGTPGSELIPELEVAKVHHIVEKGQDKRVEMYSAFADPFTNPTVSRSKLADVLHEAKISDVFVVGLATDYCVKFTAIDSAKEGFTTHVVGEATNAVDPSSLDEVYKDFDKAGVSLVGMDSEAIKKVKELT